MLGISHHAQHGGGAGNGSDPLSFCVGEKGTPAQEKTILFLSISSMQKFNVKPFF